jgi:hypothetical protein
VPEGDFAPLSTLRRGILAAPHTYRAHRTRLPGKRLNDLVRRPRSRWATRDVDAENTSTVVGQKGGFLGRGRYLDTVASDTSMPSLRSSPMRGAPHRFAVAMRLMRLRTLESIPGRPPLGRLRQAQYRRNPARCHRMTVSGFTMTSASFQRHHRRESNTHKPRSTLVSRGRFAERPRTPSWWRRARISMADWLRVRSKAKAAKSKDSDDVQYGSAAWSGGDQTSTISHWYGFSAGTGTGVVFRTDGVAYESNWS